MAITVEIYEEIRQCREKYGYGQRKTARLLKISRNTVKKYWDGSTVPWERKQGSGRKNDVLTDEHLKFIDECLEEDKQALKKQRHTAHRIYTRLCEEKGYTACESAVRAAAAEHRADNKMLRSAVVRPGRIHADRLGRNHSLSERCQNQNQHLVHAQMLQRRHFRDGVYAAERGELSGGNPERI